MPAIPSDCIGANQGADREVSDLVASADQAYDQGRFGDAVHQYGAALKKMPQAGAVYYRRGMAYEMLDRTSQAVADYLKAIELDARNFRAMENLGGIYEREGVHFSEAIALYRRARALDPRPAWKENLNVWIAMLESRSRGAGSSAVAAWHLGNKKAGSGDLKGAFTTYSRATELDPRMFQAFHSRALVRIRMEDLSGALLDLNATIDLCPTLRGALVLRGLVQERMGDRPRALTDFRRATRLDPRDPQAHYELGRILEEEKESAEALQSYEEALRLKPKPELRKMVQSRMAALQSLSGLRSDRRRASPRIMQEMW